MKTRRLDSSISHHPSEDEIRAKAHELYVQSGWIPGRDLDNWLAAEAYLAAYPPAASRRASRRRSLHAQDPQ